MLMETSILMGNKIMIIISRITSPKLPLLVDAAYSICRHCHFPLFLKQSSSVKSTCFCVQLSNICRNFSLASSIIGMLGLLRNFVFEMFIRKHSTLRFLNIEYIRGKLRRCTHTHKLYTTPAQRGPWRCLDSGELCVLPKSSSNQVQKSGKMVQYSLD